MVKISKCFPGPFNTHDQPLRLMFNCNCLNDQDFVSTNIIDLLSSHSCPSLFCRIKIFITSSSRSNSIFIRLDRLEDNPFFNCRKRRFNIVIFNLGIMNR